MEAGNDLRHVADSCGVDPFVGVDVVYSLPAPGERSVPWVVRVYAQARRARVYKQRIITGAGETIGEAAAAVLASFDERAEGIKAARERESLIACVMEMDGVPREKAERRVDRALAQRAGKESE
jgi:hypothetical protein